MWRTNSHAVEVVGVGGVQVDEQVVSVLGLGGGHRAGEGGGRGVSCQGSNVKTGSET